MSKQAIGDIERELNKRRAYDNRHYVRPAAARDNRSLMAAAVLDYIMPDYRMTVRFIFVGTSFFAIIQTLLSGTRRRVTRETMMPAKKEDGDRNRLIEYLKSTEGMEYRTVDVNVLSRSGDKMNFDYLLQTSTGETLV